jgi:membrane protein implicated in regulation of membrane protease activity
MNNQIPHIWLRNTAAVIVGVFIYLLADTVLSLLVGAALDKISHYYFGTRCYYDTRCYDNTILFQVVLRLIVAVINFNFIVRAVNRVAVRSDKGQSVAEYIVGGAITVLVLATGAANLNSGLLDAHEIIFSVFNILLGAGLFLDAKKAL